MKKHTLACVLIWLPAVLTHYLYNNDTALSQVLQWVFAALLIVGWAINTGLLAYRWPWGALARILFYTGVNLLAITMLYAQPYGTVPQALLSRWGGILSYNVLSILIDALIDFNIPHEIFVLGVLVAAQLIALVVGLGYRRVRPCPYRPVIRRSR